MHKHTHASLPSNNPIQLECTQAESAANAQEDKPIPLKRHVFLHVVSVRTTKIESCRGLAIYFPLHKIDGTLALLWSLRIQFKDESP